MFKKMGVIVSVFFLVVNLAHASPKYNLRKNLTQKLSVNGKNVLCGYVSNKWQPVTKVAAGAYKVAASPKAAAKRACKGLLKKGSFSSLSKLPGISQIAKSNYAGQSQISGMAVSGTPPALTDINDMGISNLFWRSGVIDALRDGAPSQEQCSEYWLGQNDGASGGYLACTMAEDVGYAFEPILRSATSLCYMQNVPTEANLTSGATELVSGELPAGGITKLFAVPAGNLPRLVKVNATMSGGRSQTLFIRIQPSQANLAAGYQYRAKLWFCGKQNESDTEISVLETEDIAVLLSGLLKVESVGNDAYGSFSAKTEGLLVKDGEHIKFDSTSKRTALVNYVSVSDQNHFKAAVEIEGDGSIKQKFFNIYSGDTSKRYTVSRVDGEDLQSLKFYEGAFVENRSFGDQTQTFSGAVEYRDSIYLSAPQSELRSEVEDFSFDDESFFDQIGSTDQVDSDLQCDLDADIEVNVDLTAESLQAVVAECEANNEQTSNFCRENDTLKAINSSFSDMCTF